MESTSILRPASLPVFGRRTVLVGFAAGLMNGLIGIGGGTIVVPGLVWARRADPREAIVSSLGVIFVMSTCALSLHLLLQGLVLELGGMVWLVAAGMAGAQVGSALLVRLSGRCVRWLFAAFCLLCAQYVAASTLGWVAPLLVARSALPLWAYVAVGLLSGLSSGLLGVGGALMALVGLTLVFNVPVLNAIPVALLMNLGNAGSGLLAHWRGGRIGRETGADVLRLVPSAWFGAGLGALLAGALAGPGLRLLFAAFLGYVAWSMARKAYSG